MEISNEDLLEEINKLNLKIEELSLNNKRVFTPRQGAEFLGIGYDTILREARIGRINHVKNGANYLFKIEHLEEWLDRNEKRVI